jgi:hypothetical protein
MTQQCDRPAPSPGIDPDRLATALAVLGEVDALPVDHPDAAALRLATGRLFKQVKEQRRRDKRRGEIAHDAAVTAATATGAPGRIDDETRGAALSAVSTGTLAGTLRRARACYTCKQRYTEVDAFHHQLCPPCAALNRSRREARTDLTGRRALLTGGRAKIGMHIALRLLRDGAEPPPRQPSHGHVKKTHSLHPNPRSTTVSSPPLLPTSFLPLDFSPNMGGKNQAEKVE